jgi:hypothetical protein
MDHSHNAGEHTDSRNDMKERGDTRKRGSGEITAVGESSMVSAERGDGESEAAEGDFEQLFLFMLGQNGAGNQSPLSDLGEARIVPWAKPETRHVPTRLEGEHSTMGVVESKTIIRRCYVQPRRLEDEFATIEVDEYGGFGNENRTKDREVTGLSRGIGEIGRGARLEQHIESMGRALNQRRDAYYAARRVQESRAGENKSVPLGRDGRAHYPDENLNGRENTISGNTSLGFRYAEWTDRGDGGTSGMIGVNGANSARLFKHQPKEQEKRDKSTWIAQFDSSSPFASSSLVQPSSKFVSKRIFQ